MTSSTQANSTPKVAVNDIGSEEAFLAAIDETIKYFNDGDIVEGTIVKVDRDEVLLDIGYKTEGVIPSRELSDRKSTRLNSSHSQISYAVFCLKKKNNLSIEGPR